MARPRTYTQSGNLMSTCGFLMNPSNYVTIGADRWVSSESTAAVTELLDRTGYVADISAEDATRSGFATEDIDMKVTIAEKFGIFNEVAVAKRTR
jgi:hypothetical protein